MRTSLFLCIVILGQAAECSKSLLTTLYAAAFAIEDFCNAIGQFLRPVDVVCLGVLVVERADTVVVEWSVPVRSEKSPSDMTSSRHGWDHVNEREIHTKRKKKAR